MADEDTQGTAVPDRGGAGAPTLVGDDASRTSTRQGELTDPDRGLEWIAPGAELESVQLHGFVGRDTSPDAFRLYRDLTLREWVTIPVAAIRQRLRGDEPAAPSVVWIDRDANLTRCVAVRASSYDGPPAAAYDRPPAPTAGASGSGGGDAEGKVKWPR